LFDCQGGFLAVIELNEVDVEDYMSEYRQIFDVPEDFDETYIHNEMRVNYREYSVGGGAGMTLHSVEPPDRPAYLMVSYCGD